LGGRGRGGPRRGKRKRTQSHMLMILKKKKNRRDYHKIAKRGRGVSKEREKRSTANSVAGKKGLPAFSKSRAALAVKRRKREEKEKTRLTRGAGEKTHRSSRPIGGRRTTVSKKKKG